MKIRFATAQDEEACIALGKIMHAESRFACYPVNEDKLRKVFALSLSEPKVHCLLLAERLSGEVVGMLGGNVLPSFFSDVWVAQDKFFYVNQEFRGTSAAAKLLLAFQKWCANRSVAEININMSVAIDMDRFDRFMKHAGFQSCGSNYFKPLG